TWDSWAMTWRHPAGEPFDPVPQVPIVATMSAAAGEKLFQGAQANFRQATSGAESTQPGESVPHFPLPWALDATVSVEAKTIESRNIAGLIEGGDASLTNQVVVLSAHLDHIGVTAPVNGDSINNGALDNAAGVATTLEVARMMTESGRRPRRSVLVLAVTG